MTTKPGVHVVKKDKSVEDYDASKITDAVSKAAFRCDKIVPQATLDAIAREAKASFCVVDKSAVVPELFATAYKSVIAFGRVRIVEEQEERNRALIALVEALSPHVAQKSKHAEIDSCRLNDSVAVLAFEPELITGKRGSCVPTD